MKDKNKAIDTWKDQVVTEAPYLEKCPFCGGEAALWFEQGKEMGSVVRCTQCGAAGEFVPVSHQFSCDQMAAEAWNRRQG